MSKRIYWEHDLLTHSYLRIYDTDEMIAKVYFSNKWRAVLSDEYESYQELFENHCGFSFRGTSFLFNSSAKEAVVSFFENRFRFKLVNDKVISLMK